MTEITRQLTNQEGPNTAASSMRTASRKTGCCMASWTHYLLTLKATIGIHQGMSFYYVKFEHFFEMLSLKQT